MKSAILFLIIAIATAAVTANPLFGFGGFGGGQPGGIYPNSQFYKALIERDAQILTAPVDFPADLAQQTGDVLTRADASFTACDSTAYPMPYMQRICIVQTYAAARNELKVISDEATARAQSSTTAGPGPVA